MRYLSMATTAALTLAAGASYAGITVTGSSGAGWQTFPGSLNNYADTARPYWDQRSMDGTNRNIGNYLNATWGGSLPGGSAPSPLITPDWWGMNSTSNIVNGNATNMDSSFAFSITSGASVSTTMRLEVAGNHAFNEIGWYNTADAAGAETLNPVFGGAASAPASTTFTPSGAWGLYIRSFRGHPGAGQGLLFFSESFRNRANGPAALAAVDREVQHFALFRADATPGAELYYVGVEDLPLRSIGVEHVGDYNDVVFTLRAVPTPGATALLGVAGLMASRRRRQ